MGEQQTATKMSTPSTPSTPVTVHDMAAVETPLDGNSPASAVAGMQVFNPSYVANTPAPESDSNALLYAQRAPVLAKAQPVGKNLLTSTRQRVTYEHLNLE